MTLGLVSLGELAIPPPPFFSKPPTVLTADLDPPNDLSLQLSVSPLLNPPDLMVLFLRDPSRTELGEPIESANGRDGDRPSDCPIWPDWSEGVAMGWGRDRGIGLAEEGIRDGDGRGTDMVRVGLAARCYSGYMTNVGAMLPGGIAVHSFVCRTTVVMKGKIRQTLLGRLGC